MSVTGSTVSVKRSDKPEGWGQNLQYMCCDSDSWLRRTLRSGPPGLGAAFHHDVHEARRQSVSISGVQRKDLHADHVIDFVRKYRLPAVNDLNVEMNKMLQFSASGRGEGSDSDSGLPILAMVAAPTTSLPDGPRLGRTCRLRPKVERGLEPCLPRHQSAPRARVELPEGSERQV